MFTDLQLRTDRVVALGLDVADRSRRERLLLQTGALQKAILNSATFAIIATDEKGVIQLFNAGAERLLGYAAIEVVNKISPSDIHDPDEVLARASALSIELDTSIAPGFEALAFKASRGITDSYDLTYICKDGSRFPAIVSITALRNEDESIIGYLLIGADNSVRKQIKTELTIAKAAAEKANLAKSEFLSNMSHELRSPLNAILGFAQLLESDSTPLTVAQRESTGQILQAGWYLLDLINEVLDLALIESGKLMLSMEPMSLDDVMLDCQAMIEPQAQKHGISVSFTKPAQPCFINADRTRVKQILINLLSNAIKYNNAGGNVRVEYVEAAAGQIRISVKDTGQGLAPEQLQQLFQSFNRLGQESKDQEGTGIGLVMTKRLVELMGGMIGVESTAGEGSEFWVELNRADLPTIVDSSKAAPLTFMPTAGENATRTMLYIEDNPANLKLVEQLTARRGNLHLFGAGNATLGIELAREHRPDVILMDINLPGISGVEALRMLRQDPLTRHIPVLAISANAMPHDIRSGIDAGFFRYLTKPIKVTEFMDALDVTLEHARVQAELTKDEEAAL